MSLHIGVVMDPIAAITPYKDTTLAILLEAQRRGWIIHYLEMHDLFVRDGTVYGNTQLLTVRDDNHDWFDLAPGPELPLSQLDLVFMRKDPPFDMEFTYATHILERAEAQGAVVVNKPSALRDVPEKLAITAFPHLCADTLVTRDDARIRAFLDEQGEIVLKPLDGMGGSRVFHVVQGDTNLSVVLEVLTGNGSRYAMAQGYLSAIKQGDKRILMVNGEPVPYVLARIPAEGEERGNIAAGGRGVGQHITEAERALCAEVGPMLRERGILFAGLDVIGDKLTEINVTSPTCIRELDQAFDLNIAGTLLDASAALAGKVPGCG